MTPTTTTAEWITAWGTLFTALVALIGLGVSILTARKATEETRKAHLALGLVGQPAMNARIGRRLNATDPGMTASAWNTSERPAVDVAVEVTLSDGSTWRGHTERLEQNTAGSQAAVHEPRLAVDCGPILPEHRNGVEKIVVHYSDERELCRWRYTRNYQHRFDERPDGTTTSSRSDQVENVRLEHRRGRWMPVTRS